jgi:membrane fusion protein (multidrug efflux system)
MLSLPVRAVRHNVLEGEVADLLPPRVLPVEQDAQASQPARHAGLVTQNTDLGGVELYVPVHIRLKSWANSSLRPGRRASCVVRTQSLFGFSGFYTVSYF